MIASGFTGQLKGWWDNYLTNGQKTAIITNTEIKDEVPTETAVYTLLVNILDHFTGQLGNNYDSTRTLLQNFRCKTLTDFRWYKDTFLSRVMLLPECNSSHWKAKFIDGLPHLFAERIRKILRGDNPSINYERYNYGHLIKACTAEGINLCNEIKLNQQLKHQNIIERNQLGEFCEQFGMDIPSTSRRKQHKGKDKTYYPRYKKRRYSKAKLEEKTDRKNQRKFHKKHYRKKGYIPSKEIRCFKCNKKGHMANNCWTQQKINNLDIDDDLKDKISKLFLNELDLQSETETMSDDSSNSSNNLKILKNDSFYTDRSSSLMKMEIK
ncbi:uncharacterized protein LOC141602297 [Silene latifolia]|uniref:uncharacterized protein LOC141602297 n=1 Tax=Silene latifolia TaxID=37657 RepID=UPI003D781715